MRSFCRSSPRSVLPGTIRLVALLLMLALVARSVRAGTGQLITMPLPGEKVRSGLRMTIDPRWVSGSGYRPVRVQIAPITGGVATAERFLEVRLRPRGWSTGSRAGAATATVHLPQGAAYGEAVINIPQTTIWSQFDVYTSEDGDLLTDLSAQHIAQPLRFYYQTNDGAPSILVLHGMAPDWSTPGRQPSYTGLSNTAVSVEPALTHLADGVSLHPVLIPVLSPVDRPGIGKQLAFLPDVRVLAGQFPASYYNGNLSVDRFVANTPVSDREIMRLVNDLSFLELVNARALPDEWVSYSGVDVIITSLDELQSLSQQFPEKWDAVRTWLRTGTLLCVYGVGSDFNRLNELNQLMDVRVNSDDAQKWPGWNEPHPKDFQQQIDALKTATGDLSYWQQQATIQRQNITVSPSEPPKPPSQPTFLHREIGRGQLVAIAADNPFPGTVYEWSWIFNTVPARNWLWFQRHGLSLQRENRGYWNFLMTDIGRAPVMSFLTLITLFAIVIGPLNYYLLYRRHRLYLLVVTVPFGALLVTGGLFLYATVADGLGVRARVRSFSVLDQQQGEAVSWSRQTYYAGFAPSRGLVFSSTAAVYPIDYRPSQGYGSEDVSRHTVWSGDEQNLASGYFLSRTPAQLLAVEPTKTSAALLIKESQSGGPPTITNQVGVKVNRVVLCDSQGRVFVTANLNPQVTSVMTPTNVQDEATYWRSAYRANRLTFPERFDPSDLENVSGLFGGYYYDNADVAAPMTEMSILEDGLRTALSTDLRSLQPRSYIAWTARPPFVRIGVESAAEPAGFHIIRGTW